MREDKMQISNQAVYSRNQTFSTGRSAQSGNASFSDVMSGFTSLQSSDTYQVFLPNENTAYSGGQANGLSYKIDYAENSTPENPIMIATGVDENGTPFEQELVLKDIDPRNATIVEFRALEAHLNGGKMASVGGPTTLLTMGNHGENQQTGLNTKQNFMERLVDKYNFYSSSPYMNHQLAALGYKNQIDLWSQYFEF